MPQESPPLTQSPCIGLCKYDDATNKCEGCGRSIEEVINWHTFDDVQKIAINKRLRAESQKD